MKTNHDDLPVITSFYAGAQYYHDAAARLSADCTALGLPHDIVELEIPPGFDWGRICRKKIEFYLHQLEKHRRAVVWVDVDSRVLRAPHELAGCRFDMVGYARHNRYVRDYDRYYTARFWMPQVLFFGYTPRALRFLEHLARLERESDVPGSDDYFMEEAWRSFPESMSVGFMPPQSLSMRESDLSDETFVLFQASGNVNQFTHTMAQHVAPYRTTYFRKKVFEDAASDAQRGGRRTEAAAMLQRAFDLDRADKTNAFKLSQVLHELGDNPRAAAALEECHRANPEDADVAKRIVNSSLAFGDLDKAQKWIEALAGAEDAGSRAFAESRAFRLDLERRAQRLALAPAQRPGVWWMETPYPGNFGDILNPYLVEKITGLPPRFVPRGREMLAIGSVIKFARQGTRVWGTGTPRMTDALSPDAQYCAVRGPLTLALVRQSGGTCPDILGDPALLLPRFYQPRVERRYRLGLIPHVRHLGSGISVADDVLVISPELVGYAQIEAFIDAIASCEAILTSSLHGLIVANAYGIPARWCEFGDLGPALSGDGTKFRDFFLSVGLPEQVPLDLSGVGVVDTALRRHVDQSVEPRFDAQRLLDAFPRHPPATGKAPGAPRRAPAWKSLLNQADVLQRSDEPAQARQPLHALAKEIVDRPAAAPVLVDKLLVREPHWVREVAAAVCAIDRPAALRMVRLFSQRQRWDAVAAALAAINDSPPLEWKNLLAQAQAMKKSGDLRPPPETLPRLAGLTADPVLLRQMLRAFARADLPDWVAALAASLPGNQRRRLRLAAEQLQREGLPEAAEIVMGVAASRG
jgi:tetratricopeptide (TPR) repeat protein